MSGRHERQGPGDGPGGDLTTGPGGIARHADCAAGGRIAWQVLSRGEGTVLAVFHRCLYLEGDDALCCLGDETLPRGPVNLRVPGFRVPPQQTPGAVTPWRYRSGTLCLEGQHWRVEQSPAWRPPVPPAWVTRRVVRGLRACRAAQGAAGGSTGDTGGLGAHIDARLRYACGALGDWLRHLPGKDVACRDVPRGALALLGCGPGLTPSGDDVLVGVLVMLHAAGRHDAARLLAGAVTTEAPRRTSRISAAHLVAASRGEAVEPVHDVVQALLAGEPAACATSVKRLLAYGHSSGADALRGMVLAADALAAA